MKRILAILVSLILAVAFMPVQAVALVAGDFSGRGAIDAASGDTSLSAAASSDLATQALPVVPAAHPDAITGANPPADEAAREKVYVKDFYNRDYTHYYGPADGAHIDDGTVIEAALAESGGKTLVLEEGKTYTFGSYVRSNEGGNLWRMQGIRTTTDDVIIEGNGATIRWDSDQVFVGGEGLLPVFRPDEVRVNGKPRQGLVVGISAAASADGFDAIIP